MSLFDRDHWQEIWEALAKNRLRTFLTAFGIFWGIFLLVVMLGSGNGLRQGVSAGFSNTATNSFFVWGQRTSKPFKGRGIGRPVEFSNEDTAALRREIPEIDLLVPRNQLGGFRGGATVTRETKVGSFSVMGDHPETLLIQAQALAQGRFLNAIDLAEARKVAVIGTRPLEILFERGEDPIGKAIEINGVYFKVIGVFRSRQSGGQAERDAQMIYVPFTTFQQAFNARDRVGWYAATADSGVSAAAVQKRVIDLLRKRHQIAPDDNRAIGTFNLEEQYAKIQGLFSGIQLLMWIVGLGTLAAGAIGVSNIMLIIVRERTREIGIRRAVGATPFAVVAQIVFEAILLTSIAGLVGLCAGVGLMELVGSMIPTTSASGSPSMFQNPGVDAAAALEALLILVVAGTLAGLAPALRAVAVTPVVALRSE